MLDDRNEHTIDRNSAVSEQSEELKSSQSLSDQNSINDMKDNQMIDLKHKLVQLQDQNRDTVLRLTAEIENIRRRNMQEIEKTHKFALERFISELLPVIDNLERTLSIIDRTNTELSVITEGIDLTLKIFLDTMHKFGVESVHDIHVPFNPDIHQAISTIESEEHKSNQVLSIIQKGYLLNGRLIRPGMVTVSKSKCK